LKGGIYLLSYSLGLGLPLLFVSYFYDKISIKLIKINSYLLYIKKIAGIFLVVLSISILNSLWKIPGSIEKNVNQLLLDTDVPLKPDLGLPSTNPRLIMFYQENCLSCEKMDGVLEELRGNCRKYNLEINKINISKPQNKKALKKYNIRGTPTFSFLNLKGEEKLRFVGEVPLQNLRAAASVLLGATCLGEQNKKEELFDYIFGKYCGTEVISCGEEKK
jgi:thiol:disulfide interchange protein